MESIIEEMEDIVAISTSSQDQELLIGSTSINSSGEKVNSWSSLSEKSRKNNNGGVEAHFTGTIAGRGSGGANNSSNSTRRIFTPAFKQTVLEAFISDPDCIGNQRATARKFGIHRRQVQKWLTQLDKEGEGSSSSSEQLLNPEGSCTSTPSILGRSGGSSSSSSEKERGGEVEEPVQEPVAKDPQVDLSPSSSSSNSSKRQVDLCNMSSTAMAMSLNLTLNASTTNNANSNSTSSLPNKQLQNNHFERTRNNSSPTLVTPNSIPSPNSLFSRFYGLYAHGQGHHGSPSPTTNYVKYQSQNLNTDIGKGLGNFSLPILPTLSKTPPQQRSHTRHHRMSDNLGIGPNPHYLHILDEITTAHPHDDYSLLRQALLRNEVSFTKVPPSTPKSTFFPPLRSPEDNNTWGNSGKGERSRTSSPTLGSPSSKNSTQSHSTLALEILRQQTEYMRLFQQSGLNFSDLSPEGAKSSTNPKYPWLHPLTQTASLGFPYMGTPSSNGPKKPSPPPHVFVSPKPPNNSKPKTVAAALAASRISPNSLLNAFTTSGTFDSGSMVKKRSTGPRKRGKPKQNTKPCCTITRPSHEDDYLDPTLMLEVSTSNSDVTNSNSTNGISYQHSINGVGTHFLHSILQSSERETLGNRLESSECAEIRKYFEPSGGRSPIVPPSEPDTEQITKTMALDAFTYDPEVAGDCRAVARKFGLNVRVVMKWIKESSTKTNQNPMTNNLYENYGQKLPINENSGIGNPELDVPKHREQLDDEESVQLHPRHQNPIPFQISSNKRKNSKPNQICDFQQEDDDDLMMFGDVPMDMMIPIKKRRVSSHE